jgi:hypothetical protein
MAAPGLLLSVAVRFGEPGPHGIRRKEAAMFAGKKAAVTGAIALGAIALGFLAVGFVVSNQAAFAKNYVHDQLAEKHITFTPVAGLFPDQKKVACLVQNAGKPLVTGKQAECYARYQIGLDLLMIDNGKTYFQDHYAAYLLRLKAQQAAAQDPNSPATQALVQQSAAFSQKAEDIFDGETMRGLLLTAYGFSAIGDRGAQAATACFVIAGVLTVGAGVWLWLGRRRHQSSEAAAIPMPAAA